MELELIKERMVAGLAAARKKGGINSARKSVLTPDKLDTARKLLAGGQARQGGEAAASRLFGLLPPLPGK